MTPMLRRFASCTVMPLTLAAALAGAVVAMRHVAQPASVVPPIFLASILWVAWLERVLPYRPEWNRAHGDLAEDSAYLASTSAVTAVILNLVYNGWETADESVAHAH